METLEFFLARQGRRYGCNRGMLVVRFPIRFSPFQRNGDQKKNRNLFWDLIPWELKLSLTASALEDLT